MSITLRQARPEDAAAIYAMIYELAVYEKAPEEVVTTPEEIRETLFGAGTKTEALIAECEGEFNTIIPAFADAEDAAATQGHSSRLCRLERRESVVIAVRCDYAAKVRAGCFQIVVVSGDAGGPQTHGGRFVQFTQRGAGRRQAFKPEFRVQLLQRPQIAFLRPTARIDQAEAGGV